MFAVDSGGSLDLFVQTMYASVKKGNITSIPDANKASGKTSKTSAGTVPDISVPNESKKVNQKTSEDIDSKYLELAKNPEQNKAELQKMVDEAAKAAGYQVELYHGTSENFYIFNRGYEGIHLGTKEIAQQVANSRYSNRSAMTSYKWKDIRDRLEEINEKNRWRLVNSVFNENNVEQYSGDINNIKAVKEYVDSVNGDNNPSYYLDTFDRPIGEYVLRLYTKIDKSISFERDLISWTPYNIAEALTNKIKGADTEIGFSGDKIISPNEISFNVQNKKETLNILDSILNKTKKVDSEWDVVKKALAINGYYLFCANKQPMDNLAEEKR